MRIIIERDAEAVARQAADRVADLVRRVPDCVLGLPTGATPLAMYQELIRRHREEGLSFARVVTFNLDEYVGLAPEHRDSFATYMRENFFDHIDIDPTNTHIPNGSAADLEAECRNYERAIEQAGGIDLQVLGIGLNGHIAFNEPGSSLGSRTRIKTLTRETLEANAPALDDLDQLPRLAITMGVGTIFEAKSCLLLACGAKKSRAVAAMIEGPITAQVPASALQLHRDVTVIVDEEAASALQRPDYYRDVEEARRRLEIEGVDALRGNP